ncbi:MAG: DUF4118 domain-containing protein, partial [Alphaproteobacteria bacterium]|nr:DUF4118 domain-containing protein [Alphaproteobacteria bacterium]
MMFPPHVSGHRGLAPPSAYPVAVRYLGTVGMVALALGLRAWIAPPEAGIPFLTFFPMTALVAILFGFGPGMLAAVLSSGLAGVLYLPPILGKDSFALWSNGVFLGNAVLVCWAVDAMHRYRAPFETALGEA